jgi:signal transduction histidine kinase
MYRFLLNNRDDLLARCKAKVATRPRRAAMAEQLRNGVPLFLEQLTRTLQAEEEGQAWESLKISGASGGDFGSLSEMGVTATAHGKQLLKLGYSIDQVVHDYGDLCQAITDLAVERDAPFSVDEFRTLNRCLDNAIADAVSSFSAERDVGIAVKQSAESNQRLGILVNDLRNPIATATVALSASVPQVDPALGIRGNRDQLLAALANLLQNALRFTDPQSGVTLHAYAAGDRVLIDFKDHCGGLASGEAQRIFAAFSERRGDKTQPGMGLWIAKESVEADGGVLTVRDVPGTGCVFTISLPLRALQ